MTSENQQEKEITITEPKEAEDTKDRIQDLVDKVSEVWKKWNCTPERALLERLHALIFIKDSIPIMCYPITLKCILGFPPLELESRDELLARIKELKDILHAVEIKEDN